VVARNNMFTYILPVPEGEVEHKAYTTAKILPAVARIEKMTVMGRATVTSCSNGMPLFGVRPPKDHQMKSGSDQCPNTPYKRSTVLSEVVVLQLSESLTRP